MTMASRVAAAIAEVVNADGQLPSPPAIPRAYRPAVAAPVRGFAGCLDEDNIQSKGVTNHRPGRTMTEW